tara:strand:- start:6315 stop:7535 length:1221 start_codon:yes stop_codon:yes gene_type:complete
MTRSYPEWVYLVNESGRHWHHLAEDSKQPSSGAEFRVPTRAVFGIRTNDLISIPQWISSKDSEIISEVISMETERLGIRESDGPGKTSDWKEIELNGSRTLIQSVSIPWAFSDLSEQETQFTDFVPQYSFYAAPDKAVVLWQEDTDWVAGYTRGKKWAHVQTLAKSSSPETLATELQLTLLELSARGIIDQVNRIVVWTPYDGALHEDLQNGMGLDVAFEDRPLPSTKNLPNWALEPHSISESRIAVSKQKKGTLLAVTGVLILALLVLAAIAHLWLLAQSNDQLRQKISKNRQTADRIESTVDRWHALGPAISPVRSPLDLFHQVSILLPEKGFRLTSFEIQNNRIIIIRGEGATMANALKIKGALENAPGLGEYLWEIPPPTTKGGLTNIVATGTYRFATNETE